MQWKISISSLTKKSSHILSSKSTIEYCQQFWKPVHFGTTSRTSKTTDPKHQPAIRWNWPRFTVLIENTDPNESEYRIHSGSIQHTSSIPLRQIKLNPTANYFSFFFPSSPSAMKYHIPFIHKPMRFNNIQSVPKYRTAEFELDPSPRIERSTL